MNSCLQKKKNDKCRRGLMQLRHFFTSANFLGGGASTLLYTIMYKSLAAKRLEHNGPPPTPIGSRSPRQDRPVRVEDAELQTSSAATCRCGTRHRLESAAGTCKLTEAMWWDGRSSSPSTVSAPPFSKWKQNKAQPDGLLRKPLDPRM